jgi:hypothetical protein
LPILSLHTAAARSAFTVRRATLPAPIIFEFPDSSNTNVQQIPPHVLRRNSRSSSSGAQRWRTSQRGPANG